MTQFFRQFGGLMIFLIGPEGSGKSTLWKRLLAECEGTIYIVSFSDALKKFMKLHKNDASLKEAIAHAEGQMLARQKKTIDPRILLGTLRMILQECLDGKYEHCLIDGYPRILDQARTLAQMVGEFFLNKPIVLIEAQCSREESFKRAVLERALETDGPDTINRCHNEYFETLQRLKAILLTLTHYLTVSTQGSKEKSYENLVSELRGLLIRLQGGLNPRTAALAAYAPVAAVS